MMQLSKIEKAGNRYAKKDFIKSIIIVLSYKCYQKNVTFC